MSIATEISRITSNIAAAYTALKAKGATIPTSQTSDNLATAISSIVLGETVNWTAANAGTGDVLSGKTFYSGNSTVKTGTMTNKSGTTQSATASLDTTNSRVQMTIPAAGYYTTGSKLYTAYSTLASLIGLTPDKIIGGTTILGITGTAISSNSIRYSTKDKWTANGTTTVGTLTSGAGVRITCKTNSEYSHATLTVPIDVTNLYMVAVKIGKVYGNVGAGYHSVVSLNTSIPTGKLYTTNANTVTITGTGTFMINVSALTGNYYLTVQSSYSVNAYVDVYGVLVA